MWQQLPQDAQHRLRDARRPYRAVEIAPFVALPFGGRLHARQQTHGPQRPNQDGQRKIAISINLLQSPGARCNRYCQPGEIQHRERDHDAPGEGVADTAIQRIRFVLDETDNVGPRLHAGQTAPQSGDAGSENHQAQPDQLALIEAPLEQLKSRWTGSEEEDKNPNGPVSQPVRRFVAVAQFPVARQLYSQALLTKSRKAIIVLRAWLEQPAWERTWWQASAQERAPARRLLRCSYHTGR